MNDIPSRALFLRKISNLIVRQEFVSATFEGRLESGVTTQDYWMCEDSYAQEGEILHCWYAFTLVQLKKWGNSIPSIAVSKQRIIARKQHALKKTKSSRQPAN